MAYEYRVLDYEDFEKMLPEKERGRGFENVLTLLSGDGWELVTKDAINGNYYFKKEVVSTKCGLLIKPQ